MKHRIVNALLFQLAWFGFVAGAARDSAWWGAIPLLLLAMHTLRVESTRRQDLSLGLVALAMGLALDGTFARTGAIVFRDAEPALLGAPWWILAMWLGFAWTFNHSLSWLKQHAFAGAVLGAIAGPLSYYVAAHAWGALAIAGDEPTVLLILSASWAVATAVLVLIARRLERAPLHAPG